MRQSAFTPAERMTERYNIEPNVLDDLKQVSLKLSQRKLISKLFLILIDATPIGSQVTTGRNVSANECIERRFQ
jgi:hypothetical protein